ncbi:hypothetical protein HAX54_020855, partial [Datura stramonium]|nr:hypothetical protein [Datura stramonium]
YSVTAVSRRSLLEKLRLRRKSGFRASGNCPDPRFTCFSWVESGRTLKLDLRLTPSRMTFQTFMINLKFTWEPFTMPLDSYFLEL